LKFKSDQLETKVVDGILWIRSDSTILGYLNAPSPVDDEGWYCTADLVDVDGEWIRFRGRATEVINVGGTKVSPTEVEHSILQLDFVRDVIVFGEPHSLLGQIVSARVVLETAQLTRGEAIKRIWQHCRRNLGPQMAPVKIEITTDTMVNERQKRLRSLRNV
jgi:acyl-coenzyme A synthetase/AMP-(fatty) acid ligase